MTQNDALGEPLIHLQAVNKIFYTEDIETHALHEVGTAVGCRRAFRARNNCHDLWQI